MATFTAGVDTKATGPVTLAFGMSEERAQDIFAMLLGTAAPITRERTVPDPDNEGQTKVETYQDTRKLGECLTDEITIFIRGMEGRAIEFKKQQAAALASAAITDQITVAPIAA